MHFNVLNPYKHKYLLIVQDQSGGGVGGDGLVES